MTQPVVPPPCSDHLLNEGVGVFVITGGCMEAVEALVVRCRTDLCFTPDRLDWHYVGGRAVVRMMPGDVMIEAAVHYLSGRLPMNGQVL